jgi:hypothetical protein
MPSHQKRVAKNYDSLCNKCLLRPNEDWNDEARWPNLCEVCTWMRHLRDKVISTIPASIVSKMTEEEKKQCHVT